jgi:hypothetical protein
MGNLAMHGAVVLLVLATSGCATIVSRGTQKVDVSSEPAGATVTITNRSGDIVHSGTTPFTAKLRKGAGYFKKESYAVRFTKDGYETRELALTGTMSGWYIGNILFGGLIGMLVVDPQTGAMYRLEPKTLDAALTPLKGFVPHEMSGSGVVSLADLPPDLLAHSRLIAIH